MAVTTQAWSDVSADPEVAAATMKAAAMLSELGHLVTGASPAIDWDAVLRGAAAGAIAVAAPLLMAPRRPDPARMEAASRQILREAEAFGALDLITALDAHNRGEPHGRRVLHGLRPAGDPDARPASGAARHLAVRQPGHTPASWLRSIFEYGPFTVVFNISGQPALSLPLGQGQHGLPIGVQFVTRYGREDLLFRLAAQLERAMPWAARIPGSFAGTD